MPTETHRFPTDGPRPPPPPQRTAAPSGHRRRRAPRPSSTSPAATSGQRARVGVRRRPRGRSSTCPVIRRLGSPPRLDITVRIPTRLHGRPRPPRRRASPPAVALAKADVKTASGEVSIEQVDGDCHADVRERRHRPRHGRWHRPTARARRATSASPASAGAARRSRRRAPIDIGWAGDLVSAASVSGAVTVRDAARGEVICKSTSGDVAVGVRKGTLVWLDLTTVSGRTTSGLSPDAGAERRRGESSR